MKTSTKVILGLATSIGLSTITSHTVYVQMENSKEPEVINLQDVVGLQERFSNLEGDIDTQLSVLEERIAAGEKEINNIKGELKVLEDCKVRMREASKKPSPVTRGKTSRVLTMNVSAYTDTAHCQEQWVGKTASGKKPVVNRTVAAPPEIPFGTKLYIPYFKDYPNKGIFIVEDRGGAIKGNKLDVLMVNLKEARKFGRKNLEVHIIE